MEKLKLILATIYNEFDDVSFILWAIAMSLFGIKLFLIWSICYTIYRVLLNK